MMMSSNKLCVKKMTFLIMGKFSIKFKITYNLLIIITFNFNNRMQEFEIGNNGNKILVVKQNNEFFAVGSKCSHFGAPLVKGALGDGIVRCPWHGACFNLKTGKMNT